MADFWNYLKALITGVPDPAVVVVVVPKNAAPAPEVWMATAQPSAPVVNSFDTNAVPKPKPRAKKAKASPRKPASKPWVNPKARKK